VTLADSFFGGYFYDKEQSDMNNSDSAAAKERKRAAVTVIVEREFVGEKPLAEVIIPVLMEDFCRGAEALRSFDKAPGTA
jgi:hypothetical protein